MRGFRKQIMARFLAAARTCTHSLMSVSLSLERALREPGPSMPGAQMTFRDNVSPAVQTPEHPRIRTTSVGHHQAPRTLQVLKATL